ncbi:MAG TPA: hypothetical protein VGP47_04340, partial [Parachlamydiaceae bacterium]|nr:hypothetical protein [Parachlamydiaceae bacterium]
PLLGVGYLINLKLNGGCPTTFRNSGNNPFETIMKTQRISNEIAALKKAGLPGWQQESMTLIRKSRYDSPTEEIIRLQQRGVLTRDVTAKLEAAINKVDSNISFAKKNQVKALMGQALEIKSVVGDTHHVFIHAQASNWMGLNYLVKELHKTFNPGVSTKHFKFLRSPCKLAKPGTASSLWKTFRNTLLGEEKITNVREYIGSKWYVSDNDHETREHLLSVDGYFFNSHRYESSLFFLINDSNILGKPDTIKYFYKQIISHYSPDMSESKQSILANKVFNAAKTYGNLCGNLFAICVPKEVSEEVQYRAHPFGVTCTCHPTEKNQAILSKLQKNSLDGDSTCRSISSPTIPQFRIYTPMLKPDVTPVYLLTPTAKAAKKAMKVTIQSVAREIKLCA